MGVARGSAIVGSIAIAFGGEVVAAAPKRERGHGPVVKTTITPTASGDDAHIDWARGLVIAGGIGVADRHAPSPAVARGTARRGAEDAARAAIATALAGVPLATGGTLGDKLADVAVHARIDRAVAAAITLDAEPETDGAWHVMLAVPIETLRSALTGERELPATGDAGATVLVVDNATAAAPGLGWTIRAGGSTFAAPIVWAATPPASAQHAPHVKATSAKAGVIDLGDGAAAAGASAATLFVVVTK
jgi:hypothetical protein